MLTIKHATLEATVNPLGAELSSLIKTAPVDSTSANATTADKHTEPTGQGTELIWQGDEKFWSGRAPILFPIVGALKDGRMTHGGQLYEMPRHGVARRALFECIDHSASQITMRLLADDASRAVYPWDFELQVQFTLRDAGIEIRYTVFNHDDNNMLFTLGSHPAFALQIDDSTQLQDYAVEFNQPESFANYALTDDGLLETNAKPLAGCNTTNDNTIVLSEDIFKQDALVFRDINSSRISLVRNNGGNTKTILTLDTGGAPHLGVWSKPGAPFVCIEPWLGTSDFVNSNGEFASKPDIQSLPPGQSFNHAIQISLP